MPGRRRLRERQRRIFVGCEGESERGYAAFLALLAKEMGVGAHLDTRLCKGGDPLAIVEKAIDEMDQRTRLHGAYAVRLILLDTDKRKDTPKRSAVADTLIQSKGFSPIWSRPTFEALLLRHLPGCEYLRPPTAELAEQRLAKEWPEYRKGMVARELRRRLDIKAVGRAAAVDAGLGAAVRAIGLIR